MTRRGGVKRGERIESLSNDDQSGFGIYCCGGQDSYGRVLVGDGDKSLAGHRVEGGGLTSYWAAQLVGSSVVVINAGVENFALATTPIYTRLIFGGREHAMGEREGER